MTRPLQPKPQHQPQPSTTSSLRRQLHHRYFTPPSTTTNALPAFSQFRSTTTTAPSISSVFPPLLTIPVPVSMTAVAANNSIHLFTMPEFMPTPFPGVPEDLRCRYTSKPCANLRTNKRGGGLHRFCAQHRARANENQWRVDHRRRLRKMETGNPMAPPRDRSPRSLQPRSPTDLPLIMPRDCAVGCSTTDHDTPLSTEELCILQVLLFSDEDDEEFAIKL